MHSPDLYQNLKNVIRNANLTDEQKHFVFIFCLCLLGRMKEGNVVFNNAFDTFYLRLYGVRHMVKDHYDSERGNSLPALHGLLFPISRQDSTYHGLCYTSHGALAGTRNSSMGPPHEGSIRRPIAP